MAKFKYPTAAEANKAAAWCSRLIMIHRVGRRKLGAKELARIKAMKVWVEHGCQIYVDGDFVIAEKGTFHAAVDYTKYPEILQRAILQYINTVK